MEQKREAMLKRLASRNEQRILKTAEQAPTKKIDLRATEKAFLDSSPSAVDMKTPINPATKTTVVETMSPILSFDEKADKQLIAIATWCNTMLGLDDSEEMDLGTTKAEACKRIQKMLTRKSEGEAEDIEKQTRRKYHRVFEKNDTEEIKRKCRELLIDSGIDESINEMLSKNVLLVRSELAIYSDLALQTSLLRIFLSFHPLWLKAALEAIFNTKIDAQPKFMVGAISRFFVEHVFTNQSMLKNKKFAQGSGKPIITAVGKEALHRHFLLVTMKLMFLIETAHSQRVIPSLTRIFAKSSSFKCLDDLFSELTKDLLSGSSASMKRAFAKVGFFPSYKQSFIENYDYQVKGFDSFSDGLILAKLVETVGEMPHGTLLLKLRDPAGDRIRKVNNVKTVLAEMANIGICTEDLTATNIVAGKKEAVLSILWNIIGVRVAKEKKIRKSRAPVMETAEKQKRRSAVHDEMSSEVLKMCKTYGRELDVEVLDLDSLIDGQLLMKAWSHYVPTGTSIEAFEGQTLWEKVVTMADVELHINRGIDQNVALFVKTFFERMQMIRVYNEKMEPERPSIAVSERSTSPFSVNNATFNVPCHSTMSGRTSLTQFSERQSIDTTFDNQTFTVSRESVDSDNSIFKMPKTPSRVTFVKSTLVHSIGEVIEEEEIENEQENENEETIVPSTTKKRTLMKVFEKSSDSNNILEASLVDKSEEMKETEKQVEEITATQEEKPFEEEIDEREESCTATETNIKVESSPNKMNEACEEPAVVLNEKMCTASQSIESIKSEEAKTDVADEGVRTQSEKDLRENIKQEEEDKENVYVETESDRSSVESMLTEEQKQMNEMLDSFKERQKQFVENNQLNVVMENEQSATTPELRRILKETRRLKKKQEEVAKRLGKIERQALAEKQEEAFIESRGSSDLEERPDAGHDEAVLYREEVLTVDLEVALITESVIPVSNPEVAPRESIENAAASVIQKMIRGFLARRRLRTEIAEMKQRAIVYNKVLADEDQLFTRDTTGDTSLSSSTAESKLRSYSLYGLTDANLHIVNLAATIIDRLTDLVPSLLVNFVVELNGVKLIYDILEVADRGYSYTSILHPLLNVLQKSFTKVPEDISNGMVLPLLPKLSPRLLHLMLAHSTNRDFFLTIATTLSLIGRRFPSKKVSRIENSTYFITKSISKITDPECKRVLTTLQTVCDALL